MANVGRIEDFTFNDARDRILERAHNAGFDYLIEKTHFFVSETEELEEQADLVLYFPRGAEESRVRTVRVTRLQGDDFEQLDFEGLDAVGQYRALYSTASKTAEALLSMPPSQAGRYEDLFKIPGVLFRRTDPRVGERMVYKSLSDVPRPKHVVPSRLIGDETRQYKWSLPIEGCPAPLEVEISLASKEFRTFIGSDHLPSDPSSRITLKVRNVAGDIKHVASKLEELSSSIFFELDLRFGLTFGLVRHDRGVGASAFSSPVPSHDDPVSYPGRSYAKAATTLYFYAKAAESAPLLRYLAYYQGIEHFYPTFVARDVIQRVRNELNDPRFNRRADAHVQKLIKVASIGSLAATKEFDQLLRTLKGSISEDDLREVLEADPAAVKFLSLHTNNGGLEGVPAINFREGKTSLIDQVADRIYKIRCRVVHAKEDWKEGSAPPLLPFSEDAERLEYDLHLVQYVCQKVIIAGSD